MNPCTTFYRNQSRKYFERILVKRGNIMEVNTKDKNGHPDSPINGAIKGLYFCANMCYTTGQYKPPSWSYFGPMRLLVPTEVMLDERSSLYFADFYCKDTTDGSAHYVTVVMTRSEKDSTVNQFCRKWLIQLDLENNPFLCLNRLGEVEVSGNIWVEILFTENIDINDVLRRGGKFNYDFQNFPRGGTGHNDRCKWCNLYFRET